MPENKAQAVPQQTLEDSAAKFTREVQTQQRPKMV
jgi:hypothetical protein